MPALSPTEKRRHGVENIKLWYHGIGKCSQSFSLRPIKASNNVPPASTCVPSKGDGQQGGLSACLCLDLPSSLPAVSYYSKLASELSAKTACKALCCASPMQVCGLPILIEEISC